jgi:hypothetical protein
VEVDEREALVEDSKRVLGIAFGASAALALVFLIAVVLVGSVGGGLSYQDAYARCTATPPGLPADVDVTHVQVAWSWISPSGYECVYDTPRGEESYPASASCLTAQGWCRNGP